MNTFEKIKKSWWVVISFIMFLNGLGFVYIGLKHANRNWVLEGITYEIPWFMYIIVYAAFNADKVSMADPTAIMLSFALILMLISIVRSIWVAIKLSDVYEYNEKYTIASTNLNHSVNHQNNQDGNSKLVCCFCLIVVFVIFVIIGIF